MLPRVCKRELLRPDRENWLVVDGVGDCSGMGKVWGVVLRFEAEFCLVRELGVWVLAPFVTPFTPLGVAGDTKF